MAVCKNELIMKYYSKFLVSSIYQNIFIRPNQGISCGTYLKFEREDSITKTEHS